MRVLKVSTARNVSVFLTSSSDHVTGKTGLTLTITASKDGAAFASITPVVTERGSGWYSLALTASHTDTLGDLALHITGAAADPADVVMQVVAYDPTNAASLGLTNLDALISSRAAAGVTVTVSSPVVADLSLSLVHGDDYFAADSGSIDFTLYGLATLIGGSCKLTFHRRGDPVATVTSFAGSILSATQVRFELSAANTSSLVVGEYDYDVQVTLANGHIRTPVRGFASVLQDQSP